MKRAVFVYHATLTILLFFAIASTSLAVLAESRVVERILFSFVPAIGVQETVEERELVSSAIRSFLSSGNELPSTLFTEREKRHMDDVKVLLDLNKQVASWLLFIASLIWLFFSSVNWRRVIKSVGWLLVLLPLAMLAGTLFGFSEFFVQFHEIAFANDLWLLDPTKHALIRSYPPFFFQSVIAIYGVVLLGCGALLIFGERKHR